MLMTVRTSSTSSLSVRINAGAALNEVEVEIIHTLYHI